MSNTAVTADQIRRATRTRELSKMKFHALLVTRRDVYHRTGRTLLGPSAASKDELISDILAAEGLDGTVLS